MPVYPDNLMFVQDESFKRMLRKLRKGMRLKTRIVLVLGHNHYLLRIYNYNLVMESKLKFNRFDEIEIEVLQVRPKLKLRMIGKNESFNRFRHPETGMDIKV